MEITLQKWGNSQGIRLSKSLLRDLGITTEKATFEVKVKNKELILKRKKREQASTTIWGLWLWGILG